MSIFKQLKKLKVGILSGVALSNIPSVKSLIEEATNKEKYLADLAAECGLPFDVVASIHAESMYSEEFFLKIEAKQKERYYFATLSDGECLEPCAVIKPLMVGSAHCQECTHCIAKDDSERVKWIMCEVLDKALKR